MDRAVRPEMFRESYANVWDGNPAWNAIPVAGGALYAWRPDSTYIQEPPFFTELSPDLQPVSEIRGARVLALLATRSPRTTFRPPAALRKRVRRDDF